MDVSLAELLRWLIVAMLAWWGIEYTAREGKLRFERSRMARLADRERGDGAAAMLVSGWEWWHRITGQMWRSEPGVAAELDATMLRHFCSCFATALACVSLLTMSPELTIIGLLGSYIIASLPLFVWHRARAARQRAEVEADVPLVIELLRLQALSGVAVLPSFESALEILEQSGVRRDVTKELRRACWMGASGYSWDEAFRTTANRMQHEGISQLVDTLAIGMQVGGTIEERLGQVKEAAERRSRHELREELRRLWTKEVAVLALVFVAGLCVILAPKLGAW